MNQSRRHFNKLLLALPLTALGVAACGKASAPETVANPDGPLITVYHAPT